MTSPDWTSRSRKHEDPVLIRRSRDPYGWCGNMSRYPVVHRGVKYPTTEHLFQVMRLDSEDPVVQEIIDEQNPFQAKLIAKANAERRIIRCLTEEDLDNMRVVLRLKVEQHPSLKKELLDTGSRPLVEDCSKRTGGTGLFWGAALKDDGLWYGMNWLGVLWMELREELQNQESTLSLFEE